ncbi:MAG: hypothetical protein D6730_21020 [Bacteroidetes bacterium]|nr:MAG: hypothetical protein D6730_21020 [Bacteroidota bacterium]
MLSFPLFARMGAALCLLLSLAACERSQFLPPLTDDQPPAISLTHPNTNSGIARPNERVEASIQAVDDLQLAFFRIQKQSLDNNGNELESNILLQQEISGTLLHFDFEEVLSEQPGLSRIIYTFDAIDSRGAAASVTYSLGVLPTEPSSPFRIFSVKNQRLNSRLAATAFAFNFTTGTTFPPPASNPLERDIEEGSTDPNLPFSPSFSSPANQSLGQDSVFVRTDASRFNFEAATYLTLYQAYFSAPAYHSSLSGLQAGELLIVRLTKAPQPQFAVMKLNEVVDQPGTDNDYLLFDYKVTSE